MTHLVFLLQMSSLLQDTLMCGSSNYHVAICNAYISDSSNPHIAYDISPTHNAPNNSTLLFIDKYTLHDSPTQVTIPLDRSRSIT